MSAARLVLMVCTGNVCRSPMAEYLLRRRLPAPSPWRVRSAGLSAVEALPASAWAVDALRECAIDLRPHRSRPCTRETVRRATLVLGMAHHHCSALVQAQPHLREKLFLLGDFHPDAPGLEIADPIGGDLDCYRATRDAIDRCIEGLLPFLAQLRTS